MNLRSNYRLLNKVTLCNKEKNFVFRKESDVKVNLQNISAPLPYVLLIEDIRR